MDNMTKRRDACTKCAKKSGARFLHAGPNITQTPKRIPAFNLRKHKYLLAFHRLPDKTTAIHINCNTHATSKQYLQPRAEKTCNVMQNANLATLQKNCMPR